MSSPHFFPKSNSRTQFLLLSPPSPTFFFFFSPFSFFFTSTGYRIRNEWKWNAFRINQIHTRSSAEAADSALCCEVCYFRQFSLIPDCSSCAICSCLESISCIMRYKLDPLTVGGMGISSHHRSAVWGHRIPSQGSPPPPRADFVTVGLRGTLFHCVYTLS